MAEHRFAWFRFCDHTWQGDFASRDAAILGSMAGQDIDKGKTIAFSGYFLGEKKLISDSIIRFEVRGDCVESHRADTYVSVV